MKSLYESIMDVDNNIDNLDKSILIGGHYEFDSINWKLNEPIEIEEPHTVIQSSYSDCGNKCKIITTVQEGCVLSIDSDSKSKKYFSYCNK